MGNDESYRKLVEAVCDWVWEVNEKWVYTYSGPEVEDLLGYSVEEILGKTLFDLMSPSEAERAQDILGGIAESRDPIVRVITISQHRDGREIYLETNGVPLINSEGVLTGYRGFGRDITDLENKNRDMEISASLFDNSVEGILIASSQGIIERVNRAFETITGYSAHEVVGKRPSVLKSDYHGREFFDEIWEVILAGMNWTGEIWNRRKNGEIYPQFTSISPIVDRDGNIAHFAEIFHDISERKEFEDKLRYQALHDALTSLPNRGLFKDRLNLAINNAERSGKQLAVLALDLDKFEKINDTYGHQIGDKLLVEFSRKLISLCRKGDTVSRFVGDEYTLLLGNVNSTREIRQFIQRLTNALLDPLQVDNLSFYMSATIGVALYPDDGTEPDMLMKNADLALHNAKKTSKSRYAFYSRELSEKIEKQQLYENRLRTALDNGELLVYYQPKFNLEDNRISGVEALVRWLDRDGNLISPADFIPIAEESLLIIPIGEFVLREACAKIGEINRTLERPLSLAVNLSGVQMKSEKLVEAIDGILAETGFPPELLELELTENVAMEHSDRTMHILEEIASRNISIAVDDFGTGYSSLAYLQRFPLDVLKIDRSFVMKIPEDAGSMAIARAVLSLAYSLNLKVVAEGIETEAQMSFMREHSCHEIQGFLIGKPVPYDQLIEML